MLAFLLLTFSLGIFIWAFETEYYLWTDLYDKNKIIWRNKYSV